MSNQRVCFTTATTISFCTAAVKCLLPPLTLKHRHLRWQPTSTRYSATYFASQQQKYSGPGILWHRRNLTGELSGCAGVGWVHLGDIQGAGIWLFTCVVELVSLFGVEKVVLHSGLRLIEPSLCRF